MNEEALSVNALSNTTEKLGPIVISQLNTFCKIGSPEASFSANCYVKPAILENCNFAWPEASSYGLAGGELLVDHVVYA
jgi:hypothetical protein